MADKTQDTEVSTTANEESVDTSTNEELQDTEVTDLEDDNTSFEDVDDDETEEAEDSETENQDTEPAESEEESEDDGEQKENEESESSDLESSEDSTPSPEEIKKHNAEMAARRIAEKQAREQQRLDQQQQYLEQAEDARDLALRQLQIDAYNNKVDRNRNTLENGIEKAVNSIDLFHEGSDEAKAELARRLEDFEARHVVYDDNGDPITVTGDVYEYLQKEADSIKRLVGVGARNQSKAKSKAKARTETLPSRAPKEPKVDPDLAAFDEEIANLT